MRPSPAAVPQVFNRKRRVNPRSCLGTFVAILARASTANAATLIVNGSRFLAMWGDCAVLKKINALPSWAGVSGPTDSAKFAATPVRVYARWSPSADAAVPDPPLCPCSGSAWPGSARGAGGNARHRRPNRPHTAVQRRSRRKVAFAP
jgi:hypothetical protein